MASTREKLSQTGIQILDLARTDLILSMRFLSPALNSLGFKMDLATATMGTDAAYIRFNPMFLMQVYIEHPRRLNRMYLHILTHCLFRHMFSAGGRQDKELWDLCCDICAESVVDSMSCDAVMRTHSVVRDEWYERLTGEVKVLTAERLYAWFTERPRDYAAEELLRQTFTADDHSFWRKLEEEQEQKPPVGPQSKPRSQGKSGQREAEDAPNLRPIDPGERERLEREWKENAERIRAQLEVMGREKSDETGSLLKYLRMDGLRRTDYREFLRRFSILREETGIDVDSFDYGFYNYGMELYGNLPLIEENEFREVNKVETLVIAIDTSASCQQELVQEFLRETADLLGGIGSFFTKAEIHIIECDDQVQKDLVIRSADEIQRYADHFEVRGGFGTDFRPVFRYVEDMQRAGRIKGLKGLMYFTDGMGVYPEKATTYDTAFVFVTGHEMSDEEVPDWAIRLYLTPKGLKAEGAEGRW